MRKKKKLTSLFTKTPLLTSYLTCFALQTLKNKQNTLFI